MAAPEVTWKMILNILQAEDDEFLDKPVLIRFNISEELAATYKPDICLVDRVNDPKSWENCGYDDDTLFLDIPAPTTEMDDFKSAFKSTRKKK